MNLLKFLVVKRYFLDVYTMLLNLVEFLIELEITVDLLTIQYLTGIYERLLSCWLCSRVSLTSMLRINILAFYHPQLLFQLYMLRVRRFDCNVAEQLSLSFMSKWSYSGIIKRLIDNSEERVPRSRLGKQC